MTPSDRRIAQGQSVSIHTEKSAAFDSCSAYQSPIHESDSSEILFLSHCVPNPPDKGDRIRAYHELKLLAQRFRVHLVCYARSREEIAHACALEGICASVHVEKLSSGPALFRAAVRYAFGACLTTSYYQSQAVRKHIEKLLVSRPIAATFCYSSAVAPLAPGHLPLFLDFVDIDSEKWRTYGRVRTPGLAYRIEADRLREKEQFYARRARQCYVATSQELGLLHGMAPDISALPVENGVDFTYFDPKLRHGVPNLENRRILTFTGVMDYFPNVQGVCAFAGQVLPQLRRAIPDLELFLVGRNPSRAVQQLAKLPGVTVTGAVPDVRPYLAAAAAVVVPLEIARGIQNKALEALAMGKRVLVSRAVSSTFGSPLPAGLTLCESPEDFVSALAAPGMEPGNWHEDIREAARRRFTWSHNLHPISSALEAGLSLSSHVAAK